MSKQEALKTIVSLIKEHSITSLEIADALDEGGIDKIVKTKSNCRKTLR